jgi:hypothetical protein
MILCSKLKGGNIGTWHMRHSCLHLYNIHIEFKSQLQDLLYEHLETAHNKYYEMSRLTISFCFFNQEFEPSKQFHPNECSSGGLS